MSTGVVIRLRNLPVSAGTIDIRRFFSSLSIPDGGVHIIGGDEGTAFILFATDEDARQAMLRDGQKISTEKIKLMLSSHTEMRNMIEESQRRYEVLRGLRPPEPPITNLTSRSSATGGSSQSGGERQEMPEAPEFFVELRGMPFDTTQDDIMKFLANVPFIALRLMKDDKGHCTGQGFVKFKCAAYKIEALKKDHDSIRARFVRVCSATDEQWLHAGSQLCETIHINDPYSRKRGQSGTPSNDGTPKRSRALSPIRCDNCVELRGLPPSTTFKMVDHFFYQLRFVDGGLFVELDGKSCKGRAFAEFANPSDYKEALQKDGEILDGKQIRVISISRQAMIEQIRLHKKYMKLRREEEYKRDREELERKEQEKHRKMYEEQKQKDEEEHKRRREIQMRKQREMEEWLARQHMKEEVERKRLEVEKRIQAEKLQERRAAELEAKRREDMRKREEEMREYERKKEIQRLEEIRAREEKERRLKEEYAKYEAEQNMNGNIREVEMDLEDENSVSKRPKQDYSSKSNLPIKDPSYSEMPPYSGGSQYGFQPPSGRSGVSPNLTHTDPHFVPHSAPTSAPPFSTIAYPNRFNHPPPLPAQVAVTGPPPVFQSLPNSGLPASVLPLPSTAISTMSLPDPPPVIVTNPPRLPPNLPPPPLPPALGMTPVVRLPNDAPPPVKLPPEAPAIFPPPLPVVPIGNLVPPNSLPPPQIPPPHPQNIGVADSKPREGAASQSKFVRIANSPFETSEEQVRKFFDGLSIELNGVQFVMRNKRRSGHIFIKFVNEFDAAKAAEKDKSILGGREVLVQLSSPQQMTELLRKYDDRLFETLFPNESSHPPNDSKNINKSLEHTIMKEGLTCVKITNVPSFSRVPDVLNALSGISIVPNGVHLLQRKDGTCNGTCFVEVVTAEDCVHATNLHCKAKILDSVMRAFPVKLQDMRREINENKANVFAPSGGPLPPAPVMLHPPMSANGLRMPGPPPIPLLPPSAHLTDRELDLLNHPDLNPHDFRDGRARRRSPTPPHLKMQRPGSPSRMLPPARSRSPNNMRDPVRRRTPSPPIRPRSPMIPHEIIRIHELQRRAEDEELHRRIEHERMLMRDRMHAPDLRRDPFGEPRFPLEAPRFHPPVPPRFSGPRFPGDDPLRPHFPMNPSRFGPPLPEPVAVKMSNLSFHITQEDILEFFSQFSPLPRSIRLMYNKAGRLTGDGLITFPDRVIAEAAIKKLNQASLLKRNIRLTFA